MSLIIVRASYALSRGSGQTGDVTDTVDTETWTWAGRSVKVITGHWRQDGCVTSADGSLEQRKGNTTFSCFTCRRLDGARPQRWITESAQCGSRGMRLHSETRAETGHHSADLLKAAGYSEELGGFRSFTDVMSGRLEEHRVCVHFKKNHLETNWRQRDKARIKDQCTVKNISVSSY